MINLQDYILEKFLIDLDTQEESEFLDEIKKKENKILSYDNQIKFSSWVDRLLTKEYKLSKSKKLEGKRPDFHVYFDNYTCVDPNSDKSIKGCDCDSKQSWSDVIKKLITYFEKEYEISKTTAEQYNENMWSNSDLQIVQSSLDKFNAQFDKKKNIVLTEKTTNDSYIFYKRKFTIRRIDSAGRLSPVKIFGDNSNLNEMIDFFKKYSDKKYK